MLRDAFKRLFWVSDYPAPNSLQSGHTLPLHYLNYLCQTSSSFSSRCMDQHQILFTQLPTHGQDICSCHARERRLTDLRGRKYHFFFSIGLTWENWFSSYAKVKVYAPKTLYCSYYTSIRYIILALVINLLWQQSRGVLQRPPGIYEVMCIMQTYSACR